MQPLADFELQRPASVADAVALLVQREGAMPLAGGTDIVPNLRRGLHAPVRLVDLGAIAGFAAIERQGALDRMRVEIEAEPGVAADRFDALAADAQHHIKSLIGVNADVAVQAPGTLPRSQGKAVRVRDLRKQSAAT